MRLHATLLPKSQIFIETITAQTMVLYNKDYAFGKQYESVLVN